MKYRRFIGHTKGLQISDPDGLGKTAHNALEGEDIVALVQDPRDSNRLLAGSYGHGIFASSDGGANWEGLALDVDYARTLVFSETEPGTVYLGIEPAELFRSRDSGKSWECLHIRRLPSAADWSLPYSPRGGALRTIALHPTDPLVIYGGVEQGGVIKSSDGGKTWSLDCEHVDKDVHWLSMNQSQPDVLLAATGDGLFLTKDGTLSWEKLVDEYTRAALIHPLAPGIAFAGPAHEVGEHGRIIRSTDGGENWELASNGLKLPMDDMVEMFVLNPYEPESIYAICSEGTLLRSDIQEVNWQRIDINVNVQCLLFTPS